jgi:hypothetical protein
MSVLADVAVRIFHVSELTVLEEVWESEDRLSPLNTFVISVFVDRDKSGVYCFRKIEISFKSSLVTFSCLAGRSFAHEFPEHEKPF